MANVIIGCQHTAFKEQPELRPAKYNVTGYFYSQEEHDELLKKEENMRHFKAFVKRVRTDTILCYNIFKEWLKNDAHL